MELGTENSVDAKHTMLQEVSPPSAADSPPSARTTTILLVLYTIFVLIIGLIGNNYLFTYKSRGFYLNDPGIHHPTGPDTVNVIWLLVNFIVVFFIVLLLQSMRPTADRFSKLHTVLLYIAGGGLTLFFTDALKFFASEYRPDFLARCQIDPASLKFDTSIALNASALGPWVTSYRCTSTNLAVIIDGHLSFPSGHCTYSFYTFMMLLFHFRLTVTPYLLSKFRKELMEPVLIVGYCSILFFPTLIAVSRVFDWKHMWHDVIGGAILGTVVAIFTVSVDSALFSVLFEQRKGAIKGFSTEP